MVAPFELGVAQAAAAVRAGDLTARALAESLLARCAAAASLNAFISLEPERVPDLGLVIYNPATPADADRIKSLVKP